MPVFDFNNSPVDSKEPECTYEVFYSNESETSAAHPILILRNRAGRLKHHSNGVFTNPIRRTAFEFKDGEENFSEDILRIDARFVSLLKWLGENHINVRLSGAVREDGYAVYKIREIAFGGGVKLSAEDGFLQFMIERLLSSDAPSEEIPDEDEEETGDSMKLTSIQSITDFITCAGRTLPDNIRLWARRNLAVARSHEVSAEERRHAQRALSIMMNIQWKGHYFEAIDPQEARRILDEELYGMEQVKQRIIETIIQINRTHTLPAYGLLLIGAGFVPPGDLMMISLHGGYSGIHEGNRIIPALLRFSFFPKTVSADGIFCYAQAGAGFHIPKTFKTRVSTIAGLGAGYRFAFTRRCSLDLMLNVSGARSKPPIPNPDGPGYVDEKNIRSNSAGYLEVGLTISVNI